MSKSPILIRSFLLLLSLSFAVGAASPILGAPEADKESPSPKEEKKPSEEKKPKNPAEKYDLKIDRETGKEKTDMGMGTVAGAPAANVNGMPILIAHVEEITNAMCAQPKCADQSNPLCRQKRCENGQERKRERRRTLEMLINEVLLDQIAQRQQYAVDPAEVEAKYKEIETMAGGDKNMKAMIAQSGRTQGEFRDEIRAGLLRQRVQQEVYRKAAAEGLDPEVRFNEFLNGLRTTSNIEIYE